MPYEYRYQMTFHKGATYGPKLDSPEVGAAVKIHGIDHGKTTVVKYRPGWTTDENETHADVLVLREEGGTHWASRGNRNYHSPEIMVYERRTGTPGGWWYTLTGWELSRPKKVREAS